MNLCYNFVMRKFPVFITLLSFLIFQINAFAIEEVVLEIDDGPERIERKKEDIKKELTFYEKIENIKNREITDTSKSHYLFHEILTKRFEKSPIETMQLYGIFRSDLDVDIFSDDTDTSYGFNDLNVGVKGELRDDKTFYEARLRLHPQDNYTYLQFMPSNFYIGTRAIPHHTVYLGNVRTPTGYEGGLSTSLIPFVSRSQIARNFGNTRQVGIKIKGSYDYIDYDIGGYSSDTYFRKFFPGAEFAGWATLKPLAKTDGKYGKLKIGGGVTAGQNDIDYFIAGAHAGYEYKKIFADFEWAKADGYNGAKALSSNKAEGFNTTLGYKITPKVHFLTRYDQYTPNLSNSKDIKREYSAGINYYVKGQALKIMLNYVFCQNDIKEDSHRIIVGTQILL